MRTDGATMPTRREVGLSRASSYVNQKLTAVVRVAYFMPNDDVSARRRPSCALLARGLTRCYRHGSSPRPNV